MSTPPEPTRCTCRPGALDGDCPVGAEVGNHPIGWTGLPGVPVPKAEAEAERKAQRDAAGLLDGLDDMSTWTPGDVIRQRFKLIAIEIRGECERQAAKWGADRTLPDGLDVWQPVARTLDGLARSGLRRNGDNWADILLEEVGEALQEAGDKGALRGELVQVAAVCLTWIDALDRAVSDD